MRTVAHNMNSANRKATGTVRRLLIVLNYVVLVGSWVVLASGDAYAWGAGIHIVKGSYILDHLHLILPSVAQLLRAFPNDFLYGCISADFFVGKGHRRRDDHCHNWSVGLRMLAGAETPRTKAFCYGYLAHLAADIIAHNYYIPNQLYLTSSTKRLGHLYWEFSSDVHIDPSYWGLARRIVETQNQENDASMESVVKKKIFSLKTKKRVYVRALNLTDLERWRQACKLMRRNSRWSVSQEYVDWMRNLSISLAIEFLRGPESSVCLNYDPVGTRNITRAKRLRRSTKRLTGTRPVTRIFEIPGDLTQHDTGLLTIDPASAISLLGEFFPT